MIYCYEQSKLNQIRSNLIEHQVMARLCYVLTNNRDFLTDYQAHADLCRPMVEAIESKLEDLSGGRGEIRAIVWRQK